MNLADGGGAARFNRQAGIGSKSTVPISRRNFLLAPAAIAATSVVPCGLLGGCSSEASPLPDLSSWEKVRAQFPLDPGYAHFASFFLASHPALVQAEIDRHRRALDNDPFLVLSHNDPKHEPPDVRTEIARYLGGRPEEVCLTANTTTGLALVYHGLPLKPGDEVLTTTHDHFVHHESIRLATARCGASMRKVALFREAATATTDEIVSALLAAIGPRTRVIGLTWVHSSTGIRLPIREIASAVRDRTHGRVLIVLDGVHGLGAAAEAVASLGCDYFCAGTHKWMFAPRGTGLVWASAANWAHLLPIIPSFTDPESRRAWREDYPLDSPTDAKRMTPGGFVAYEYQWAIAAAFRMHQAIGRFRVAERIRSLNTQCKEGLAANPKLTLHTPMSGDLSAGMVAFEVAGLAPDVVVRRLLAKRIIATTSPYRVSYVRLAPSLVNTPQEVAFAIRAVGEVAAGV